MNRTTAERVQLRKERNQTIVRAKVSENFQAGLGVASVIVGGSILVYTFTNWAALRPPLPIVGIATGAGAVWFGVLSVVRFSLDEMRDMYEWWRLQELAASYYLQIDTLKAENAELRRELKRANALIRTQEFEQASAGAKEVITPEDKYAAMRRNIDAILQRWAQGLPYGRDHVHMTEGEWRQAMEAMEAAGVAGRGGPGGRQRVVTATDLTQAQQAVERKLTRWEKFKDTNFTPA